MTTERKVSQLKVFIVKKLVVIKTDFRNGDYKMGKINTNKTAAKNTRFIKGQPKRYDFGCATKID